MSAAETSRRGICYLVGAGPGDPGLLTVRGRECLERAELVVYDALVSPGILAAAPESAERVYAGKRAGAHALPQEKINELLVRETRAGRVVVRLKGGDPFLFGRGGEEADALAAAGCAFEVVPGVSSALAGPAYAGIPVTDRRHNSCLTIFTGHEDPEKGGRPPDYAALAAVPGTLVMLMGVERLAAHCEGLREAGMPGGTPAALIEWATTPRQRTLTGTLDDLARRAEEAGFRAPCVVVIGGVVGLRERIAWYEKGPLFGRRIAVTRARKQAGKLVSRLRELGADAFEMPTIRIEPAPDPKALRDAAADAHLYDWIVFTSPNGADAFFDEFFRVYEDARELGAARIAAIGPATSERVRARGLGVDLQPEKFVAEAVLEALRELNSVENLKFLLPRAEGAREVLAVELEKAGAIVDEVAAYRTVPETGDTCGGIRRFVEEGADIITFTSSSTASNFAALRLPWPPGLRTASIGPVTSATLRELGLPVDIEASRHDIPGLVEAVCRLAG